jgi:hypothetical protein
MAQSAAAADADNHTMRFIQGFLWFFRSAALGFIIQDLHSVILFRFGCISSYQPLDEENIEFSSFCFASAAFHLINHWMKRTSSFRNPIR